MKSIRRQLLDIFRGDEPEYGRAAALGTAALPVLREMVSESDEDVAASAVYAAALIGTAAALPIMAAAACRADSARLHTAYALETFVANGAPPDQIESAAEILAPMFHDPDPDVCTLAERAAVVFPQGVFDQHMAA